MIFDFNKANNLKKYFLLILISLITMFLGSIFVNLSLKDTDAKTTNNSYNFYVFGLGKSPQSYSESSPGIFSTNDYCATTSYGTSPGTFKVNVTITRNDGGGCSATSSSETDAGSSAYAKGTSYAHGFTGQQYSYSVTYSVKPKSGFQVYYDGGMQLLNQGATSTDSVNNVADIIADKSTLFSNASSAWSTSEQSATYTFSLSSHTGWDEISNEYYFYWIFAPVRYTVTYKVDNSTYSTKYVDYCANYSLPSAPSKVGYTFKGWYTKESGGDPITSSSIKTSASNETLYAQWEKLSYRINVNMLNTSGVEDYTVGTFSQTYNGQTKTGLNDQYFASMYIGETMKISDIVPAIGYALVSVDTNKGTITKNSDGSYTFTANFSSNPAGSSTWDAIIEIKMKYQEYNLLIDTQGGTYEGESSPTNSTIYKQIISLTTPSKEGYIFKGWEIVEGEPTLLSNQYFSQAQEFDGLDDYINIGRDKMYSDKITIAFNAYMDDWSDYGSNNMRLISCTETGGWNFESNSGKIQFAIYDKGYGYKSITVDKSWSTLESGWHSFVATFDGKKAYLYIDNVLLGTSANFSSGLIGYNANNAIFIGAEASNNSSSPYGQYFKGKIQNLIIVNECINLSDLSTNANYYLITSAENIEIKAIWEETWTAHTQAFNAGDGSIENPYQIANAEQLAYLSSQVYNGETYSGKYFELTENIDLSNYYWQPIGIVYDRTNILRNYAFEGCLNGNNFKITGLKTMNGSTYAHSYQGLFGYIGNNAQITNINLENADIKGSNYIGGIVALAEGSVLIKGNNVFGSILGSEYTGGIAGRIIGNVVIESNYNHATINAYKYVGGIVGGSEKGTQILKSFNAGNITATSVVGGIIGQNSGSVKDCGNESTINGNSIVGSVVGSISSGATVYDCYSVAIINVNSIFGENSGGINRIISVNNVNDNIYKTYLGSDFSAFAWFNNDLCPLPKNLALAGEFAQEVTVNNLTEAGFSSFN